MCDCACVMCVGVIVCGCVGVPIVSHFLEVNSSELASSTVKEALLPRVPVHRLGCPGDCSL